MFPLHLQSTDLVGVQVDHLKEKDNFALLEQARIIYSAGFFLTASAESMLTAAKHAAANNKIYCVNISAPFLLQVVSSVCACCAQTYGIWRIPQLQCCVAQCVFAGCSVYTCVLQTRFVLAFLHLHWHNARQNIEYMKPSVDNQTDCTYEAAVVCVHRCHLSRRLSQKLCHMLTTCLAMKQRLRPLLSQRGGRPRTPLRLLQRCVLYLLLLLLMESCSIKS